MKLQDFRYVVVIAEQGSLRTAARSLQLAQSALSPSLSELERELGAPLFERRARGMVVTSLQLATAFGGKANSSQTSLNQRDCRVGPGNFAPNPPQIRT